MNRLQGRAISLAAMLCATTCLSGRAHADGTLSGPPPIRSTVDENNVDLVSGGLIFTVQDFAIGPDGPGGLVYRRNFVGVGWRDDYTGTIVTKDNVEYAVSIGGMTETFTKSGTQFTSKVGSGSTLTNNGDVYTYTTADGVVFTYDTNQDGYSPYEQNGQIRQIAYPTGEIVTLSYKTASYCPLTGGCNPDQLQLIRRVRAVSNNLGYQLHYTYSSNANAVTPASLNNWYLVTGVTGINLAVDYCSPGADTCPTFTQTWPHADYATSGTSLTVTDTEGRVSRYTYDSFGRITALKRPGSTSDSTSVSYSPTTGLVQSVTTGAGTWNYGFADFQNFRTVTRIDPLQHQLTVQTNLDLLVATAEIDDKRHTWMFDHDGYGRLTRITLPEGDTTHDYIEYTYGPRGNVKKITRVPKNTSPDPQPANIISSAVFPDTCDHPASCNKPTSVTDENSHTVDFTYDDTTGQLVKATLPQPKAGLARPEMRYTYEPQYAWYKDASGTQVKSSTAVSRLTHISSCSAGSAPGCVGTSSETITDIKYWPGSAPNNVLPVSVSSGSGDAAHSTQPSKTQFDYNSVGDVAVLTGPLGDPSTVHYRYNLDRELTGVIGQDPDGAGTANKYRAMRVSYTADGDIDKIEQGTVNGYTDPQWANFISLQSEDRDFDAYGRLSIERVKSGTTVKGVLQYTYDAANHLTCRAVRMNPAAFGTLPADACSLGTTGTDGPDRIEQYNYNTIDQIDHIVTGLHTPDERTEYTFTYIPDGYRTTIADAKNNLTTIEYDPFDRPYKVRYPSKTTPGTSSTTDYEELAFDPASNVKRYWNRARDLTNFTYTALNQVDTKDVPGSDDVTYDYDNFGQLTAARSGQTSSFTYDALGRVIDQGSPLGHSIYEYNKASQRTKMTWPDGQLFVTYDYDDAGELKSIRESGAASGARVLATFDYDDLGRRLHLYRGNGITTTYSYTHLQLSNISHSVAAPNAVSFDYQYNAAGQIDSKTTSNDSYVWSPAGNFDTTYAAANGLNQYSTVGSQSVSYDNLGNTTNDGSKSYQYDFENKMTTAGTASYSYDPLGRLFRADESASRKFAYDGRELITETDPSGAIVGRYVFGSGEDEPIVYYDGPGQTSRHWLISNEAGSIIAITNAQGVAETINTYDAYGLPSTSNSGRFQYTGQVWLSGASAYNYRSRIYDPRIGRFLQTDRIGLAGGFNLYSYVGNDPIDYTDPNGDFAQIIIGAGIGAVSGIALQVVSDVVTHQVSSPAAYLGAGLGGAVTGGLVAAGMPAVAGLAGGAVNGFITGLDAKNATLASVTLDTVEGGAVGFVSGKLVSKGALVASRATLNKYVTQVSFGRAITYNEAMARMTFARMVDGKATPTFPTVIKMTFANFTENLGINTAGSLFTMGLKTWVNPVINNYAKQHPTITIGNVELTMPDGSIGYSTWINTPYTVNGYSGGSEGGGPQAGGCVADPDWNCLPDEP